MPAWRAWYHVTFMTHGSWLRGDPRGWRTRHHREHVEGDYKHPPPREPGATLHAQSICLMTRPRVALDARARVLARDTLLAAFDHHKVEVIALALDDHHVHLLARFPDHRPRHWVGIAKKRSARALTDAGIVPPGKVWAIRSRAGPITDRAHQVATFRYILKHAERRALTWRFTPDQRDAPSYSSPWA